MGTPADAKAKAVAAYDAAADAYDEPANSFWARFGRRTVERLGLRPGQRVLDVCCGTGASAIPAADAVGPAGSVLGIDLSENLLALARAKAAERGLANADFRAGDLLALPEPDKSFDAVVCVFGVFFVPDMPAAVRELWRVVRPGGQLAVTTWGARFFEPASTAFWNAIRAVRPDLYRGFNPWDRIAKPAALEDVLAASGIGSASVVEERGSHRVAAPEDWWLMVVGSGYRGTVDQLDPAERERVRQANLAFVRDAGVDSVEANVIYATATKPPG